MASLAVVLGITLPFLFFWRTAVYCVSPAHGDASLGWPLIYAFAQNDAGLSSFRLMPFLGDLFLGAFIGILWTFFHRCRVKHRSLQLAK